MKWVQPSIPDASSSNEAVHLQQRLRSLSSELVTLRNRLHVTGGGAPPSAPLNGHSLAAYQQGGHSFFFCICHGLFPENRLFVKSYISPPLVLFVTEGIISR
ncbi:uncharacterized protein TNIN_1061 [Trichonephila inaurata madagascariensis]|uniref:Uncharacterized protein n=1 Tax=Trichonephila inaurata madagascariensis TaxID=2747483 RepID=A0A8X6X1H5_9ARAC|nr:uncharacterized protein TNIN_1061 [Trichonephila inaurata madagascariensis]